MDNYALIKGTSKFELDRWIDSIRHSYVPCGEVVLSFFPFFYMLPIIRREHLIDLNKDDKKFSMDKFEKKWEGITEHMI